MAKNVDIKLHAFTCEFAGDEGDRLELTGRLMVFTFDDPSVIKTEQVLFDFPEGIIRLRKGETKAIEASVRVTMSTPAIDPPGIGEFFVKFGGNLLHRDPNFDIDLGEQWQTLSSRDVINPEPFIWRFYFGKHNQIARADFSTVFAHPL
jgi:hypothetical protein